MLSILPRRLRLAVCLCCLIACQQDAGVAGPAVAIDATLTKPALCARDGADAVRDLFCAATPANVRSLADLQKGLALVFLEPPAGAADGGTYPSAAYPSGAYPSNGSGVRLGYTTASPDDPSIVLLAHSTALSGQLVSPINPRAILLNQQTALAFTRGVQQVELTGRDRVRGDFNFYLLRFEQACTTARDGCTPADRYSARIESSWSRVSLQDAEELKNTPSDCRQCHQRASTHSVLLMRELNGPWTHFLAPENDAPFAFPEPTGGDLMRDFLAAKGDETYAALPMNVLRAVQAFTLRAFVDGVQPLVFDGLKTLNERWPQRESGYPTEPQRSETWDAAYAAFSRGEQLALPYFAPRATDPDKQAQLTAAYREHVASGAALPDLADIYPDDARTRAEIGLQTDPTATPAQTLIQACGSCHNDVLDQTLSRARFNIALERLDRAERDRAIARLTMARGAAGAMPPDGARQIDPAHVAALVDYLKQPERSSDDDALLERAAELGMAGTR